MFADRKKKITVIALAVSAALSVTLCAVLLLLKGGGTKNPVTEYEGLPTPTVVELSDEEDAWSLLLVNRSYVPEPDYEPELTEIEKDSGVYADTRVAQAYLEMQDAAMTDGIDLPLAAGYVSTADQKTAFEAEVKTYTDQGMDEKTANEKAAFTVSPPGRAEENYGLSVGFVHENGDEAFTASVVYQWLRENAADYGFIERYTEEKEDITHMKARPWHWRYVGKKAAREMCGRRLSLEEYVPEQNESDTPPRSDTPAVNAEQQQYLQAIYKKWQKLDELEADNYFYFDLDRDGWDEMIVKAGHFEAATHYDAYRWEDGALSYALTFGSGHTWPYAKEGAERLTLHWGHMGAEMITEYWMEGGEIKEEKTLDREIGPDESYVDLSEDNVLEVYTPEEFHAPASLEDGAQPLSVEEAGRLFKEANHLYYRWLCNPPYYENAKKAEADGRVFRELYEPEYADLDELTHAFESYFADPDIYLQELNDYYRMIDGKLYENVPGMAGDITYTRFSPEILFQNRSVCFLRINSEFTVYEDEWKTIESHDDSMLIYTADGWKFAAPFEVILFNEIQYAS